MKVDDFPILSYSLEDQCHATRCRFRSPFIGLRLRPKAGNNGTIATQHAYGKIADIELDVFDIRVRAFSVLA
jgi:hypothetical protein